MSTKPVLITTQHRGVFAGLIPVDQDLSVKAMPLKSARMAIYWGTSKGVMELCDTGPTSKSRISAPADQPLAFQPRRIARSRSRGARLPDNTVYVGRPVSRRRDDGATLEVTRLCTIGAKNACSFLYGAAARATFALGYKRIGTYILKREPGTSLVAAGWKLIGETPGKSWSVPSRPRDDNHPIEPKLLYQMEQSQ